MPDRDEEVSVRDLSRIFGALSHPARRAMLTRLTKGPVNITEMAAPFAMSLNAVSKHLKVLERAGLIHRRRQGRDHVITFHRKPLRRTARWLQEFAPSPRADKRPRQ